MSQTKWIAEEDGTLVCIARVTNTAGTLVTQATVDTIDVEVCRLTSDDTLDAVTLDTTATVADTIYDTAQTNSVIWPSVEHPSGYNLLYKVAGSAFPTGAANYNIELMLNMSNGDTIPVRWKKVYVEPRFGDDA